MRVKMRRTNGVLEKGIVYELKDELAKDLIRLAIADPAEEPPTQATKVMKTGQVKKKKEGE